MEETDEPGEIQFHPHPEKRSRPYFCEEGATTSALVYEEEEEETKEEDDGWEEEPVTYLSQLNPLHNDGKILFRKADHKYAFLKTVVSESGEEEEILVKDHVISVTELLDTLFDEFPPFIAHQMVKSINTRFAYWYNDRKELQKRFGDDPSKITVSRFKGGPIWPDKYFEFVPLAVFKRILRGDSMEVIMEEYPWLVLPTPLGEFTTTQVEFCWQRRGSLIHWHIERFVNREPTPSPPFKEWPQVLEFFQVMEGIYTWDRSEVRMAFEDLYMCGSCDMIVMMGDKRVLLDFKVTPKIKLVPEEDLDALEQKMMHAPFDFLRDRARHRFSVQLNLYKIGLRQYRRVHIDQMIVVVFHRTNKHFIRTAIPDLEKADPRIKDAMHLFLSQRKQKLARLRQMDSMAMHNDD